MFHIKLAISIIYTAMRHYSRFLRIHVEQYHPRLKALESRVRNLEDKIKKLEKNKPYLPARHMKLGTPSFVNNFSQDSNFDSVDFSD